MAATERQMKHIESVLLFKDFFCHSTTTSEYLTESSKKMYSRFRLLNISDIDAVYYLNSKTTNNNLHSYSTDTNVLVVARIRGDERHGPPIYLAVHGIFTFDPLSFRNSGQRGFVFTSYDPHLFMRDVFERRDRYWNRVMQDNLYIIVKTAIEKEDEEIHIEQEDNNNGRPTRMLLQLLCMKTVCCCNIDYKNKLPKKVEQDIEMFNQMKSIGLDYMW